jgi:transketolase
MPSWELFAEQSPEYRERVLPAAVTARVAIEAASSFGWHRWIGDRGVAICLDHFGASAPADRLYSEFGLTAARVAETAARLARGTA